MLELSKVLAKAKRCSFTTVQVHAQKSLVFVMWSDRAWAVSSQRQVIRRLRRSDGRRSNSQGRPSQAKGSLIGWSSSSLKRVARSSAGLAKNNFALVEGTADGDTAKDGISESRESESREAETARQLAVGDTVIFADVEVLVQALRPAAPATSLRPGGTRSVGENDGCADEHEGNATSAAAGSQRR